MRYLKTSFFIGLCVLHSVIMTACVPVTTPTEVDLSSQDAPIGDLKPLTLDQVMIEADCWLENYDTARGHKVGKGQCTELARLLTTAPGYGLDSAGLALGGYDYIKLKESNGRKYPLLRDIKNEVNRCDNLVLVRSGDDPAGHTVVVYNIDLTNDKLYYLEQNFPTGSPIKLSEMSISKNEDKAYVIQAGCNEPKYSRCEFEDLTNEDKPLTVQNLETGSTQNNQAENRLDKGDPQSIIDWVKMAINNGDASLLNEVIPKEGIFYSYFIEGGQLVTKEEYIQDLQERLDPTNQDARGYISMITCCNYGM